MAIEHAIRVREIIGDARYVVYVVDEDHDIVRIGSYSSLRAAERAARRAVAGTRGASAGCIPACAPYDRTIDGYADRDGGEDANCSWIEHA